MSHQTRETGCGGGGGSVSVPCVKGPLGFLLKATARQAADETDKQGGRL